MRYLGRCRLRTVDWGVAARYAVTGALIIGAVILAVFIFDAVWARVGFFAAAALVAVALYFVNRWSKKQAAHEQEKLERS
jgi:membrane protein implicated in regulation of membrane protease activity